MIRCANSTGKCFAKRTGSTEIKDDGKIKGQQTSLISHCNLHLGLYLVMNPSEMLVDNARDGGCEVAEVALLHFVLPVY
jgi:hypothetical protein